MSDEWQVLTRSTLIGQGATPWSIRASVARGELRSVGRGLYLAGPRLAGDDGWLQDVVIAATAADGMVTGQSAAALHQLDGFDPGVPITVAVGLSRSSRSFARRSAALRPPARIGPLDVAAVDETLLGLGAVTAPRPGCRAASHPLAPDELVELAVEAALREQLTTIEALRSIVSEGRRRPGAAVLAAVLDRRGDQVPTGSYLETRCVQVLRSAGLDDFERQVVLHDGDGWIGRADFRRGGVVIEVVGKKWHEPRIDADSHRYTRLCAAGYRPLLFTFTDIEHRPGHVIRATASAQAADEAA